MKKNITKSPKLWVLAILIFAITAGFFILTRTPPKKNESIATTRGEKSHKMVREVFSQPVELPAFKEAPQASALEAAKEEIVIPVACRSQWEAITESSLSELPQQLENGSFEFSLSCQKEEMLLLKEQFPTTFYAESCKSFFEGSVSSAEQKRDELKPCVESLTFFRALIIDLLSGKNPDPKKLDSKILVNKILSRFMAALQQKDKTYFKSMIDELIVKEPDLYGAAKIKVVTSIFSDVSETSLAEFHEAVALARQYGVQDSQLDEAEVLMMAKADNKKKYVEFIDQRLKEFPNSAIYHYYSANRYFAAKDKPNCLEELNQAIKLDPGNARFQETRKRFLAGDETDIFNVSLTVNFNDF